jgi:hypothetical protein
MGLTMRSPLWLWLAYADEQREKKKGRHGRPRKTGRPGA